MTAPLTLASALDGMVRAHHPRPDAIRTPEVDALLADFSATMARMADGIEALSKAVDDVSAIARRRVIVRARNKDFPKLAGRS